MPVAVMAGVMADIAVTGVGMRSEDMPPAMSRVDTLVSVLAVDVGTMWRGPRAATRAMQVARVIGMAADTGAAVHGEAVIGIRPMGILGSAIMARATVIHLTGITVTHITDLIIPTDTILISTDTGPTRA